MSTQTQTKINSVYLKEQRESRRTGRHGTLWKSNYKFDCPACNKTIKRGEWITKLVENLDKNVMITRSDQNWNYSGRMIHIECNMIGYWTEYACWKYSEEEIQLTPESSEDDGYDPYEDGYETDGWGGDPPHPWNCSGSCCSDY